jgi:predicted CoA-binding protein
MDHDHYTDDYIAGILDETKTIAVVGASPSPDRASHEVMHFLQTRSYRVIPVNPNAEGTILGEKVYASLAQVPQAFDMVDIFRNSQAAGEVVDQAVAVAADRSVRTVWMQLDVRNDEAAQRAEAAGLRVVMDRCPKIEYARLRSRLAREHRSK